VSSGQFFGSLLFLLELLTLVLITMAMDAGMFGWYVSSRVPVVVVYSPFAHNSEIDTVWADF
jgi:hypothetical protein